MLNCLAENKRYIGTHAVPTSVYDNNRFDLNIHKRPWSVPCSCRNSKPHGHKAKCILYYRRVFCGPEPFGRGPNVSHLIVIISQGNRIHRTRFNSTLYRCYFIIALRTVQTTIIYNKYNKYNK